MSLSSKNSGIILILLIDLIILVIMIINSENPIIDFSKWILGHFTLLTVQILIFFGFTLIFIITLGGIKVFVTRG